MENPTAAQVHYGEYQLRAAWVNANDWQFEKAAERHPVREAVAQALIALAQALTPATNRDTRAA